MALSSEIELNGKKARYPFGLVINQQCYADDGSVFGVKVYNCNLYRAEMTV